jgi:two-component system NtrC family sensor kinase
MRLLADDHPPIEVAWLRSRSALLIVGTLLAVLTIAGLSMWDVKRRHAESMEDFGQYQERLARSLATNLETHLKAAEGRPAAPLATALVGLQKHEQPGVLVALIWAPGTPGFVTLAGQPTAPQLLHAEIRKGLGAARLHRDRAAALGLPRRAAVAGLASFQAAPGQVYWLAVVATALRARDREDEASWRALLAVLVAAGAVLVLGGVALHWQRQELRTQQALAVEEARRRREGELERASRAATLGTLAMGITHELSTPLGIIVGRAEQLVARLAADERGLRSAQVIQEQAVRMGQVIRGILGLVRDQAPSANQLSPEDICRGAMALVWHRFAATATALRYVAPTDAALPMVRGDPHLLEQAVVNLLLNACDACPAAGQVTLRVCARDGQVRFVVTDNGVGISEEAAARAMEPFFTTKPVGQGAGLGLAITQEIVKSHRGSLHIRPLPEGGTCAEIVLPQAEETVPHGD